MPVPTVPSPLQGVDSLARFWLLRANSADPDISGPALVLDLDEVPSLTAAGLGELVVLHSRLRESGGRLVLCNVGELVYQSLHVTGLTKVLEIRRPTIGVGKYPSPEQADEPELFPTHL